MPPSQEVRLQLSADDGSRNAVPQTAASVQHDGHFGPESCLARRLSNVQTH
jgi:hypothetical protein